MELVERIARVIAGYRLSRDAYGPDGSAADFVDASWPAHEDEALMILEALREQSTDMLDSGTAEEWRKTIAREMPTPKVTVV